MCLFFFFYVYVDPRDFHYPLRRQRQMCIRDSFWSAAPCQKRTAKKCSGADKKSSTFQKWSPRCVFRKISLSAGVSTIGEESNGGGLVTNGCLLYTSDAADEEDSVDLGGRRHIKKKKKKEPATRSYQYIPALNRTPQTQGQRRPSTNNA